MDFDFLYAVSDTQRRFLIGFDNIERYFDERMIELYGAPAGTTDEEADEMYYGDDSKAVHIGTLFGVMILGEQMYRDGENLYLACDDIDGDLEYVISSLIEAQIITEGKNEALNIFYIRELVMEEEYDTQELKVQILRDCAQTAFSMCFVMPDIVAYYPLPLKYRENPVFRVKHDMAQIAAADILKRRMQKPDDEREGSMHLTLDEDQLNFILGRRIPSETYPESAKDPEQWELYEEAGFTEAAETRLLYRKTKE